MKYLTYLFDAARYSFAVGEKPFLMERSDLAIVARIGVLVYRLMQAVTNGLATSKSESSAAVREVLFGGLHSDYQTLGLAHPGRLPVFWRVDLMFDEEGCLKIAEIDPSNKHGLGVFLATRIESGAGERQKMIPLLAPMITDDVTIVLGPQDDFFRYELRYFAQKLAEHTGKKVDVFVSTKVKVARGGVVHKGLVLDLPFCDEPARGILMRKFLENPGSFVNPPRHHLGGKAIMTLPYEHQQWLEGSGMTREEVDELKGYLPPTFLGPFVAKEVFSSGAKGVSFHGVDRRIVAQKFVEQKMFDMGGDGGAKYVRLACFFVGDQLAEAMVTATSALPVHCGPGAVNYHPNVKG